MVLSLPARAQSVDYGALEQLFGEPVTTSATGQPQRATEVPANMEIITADEIRRSGAYDIPGVLSHVVGIDVMQSANNQTDLGVRGYNQAFSPTLLVLVDGRQVYADYFGFTPWTAIPVELDAIRQIEVVKGPNSALFGFNALSGVINIVTFNPLHDDVSAASIRGGTQRMVGGSLVKSGKIGDKAALRLSLGAGRDDDFSTPIPPTAGIVQRKNENRFSLNALGIAQIGENASFELEATHTKSNMNAIDPTLSFSNNEFDTTSVKGKLRADSRFGLIQATAYTNWITHNSNDAFNSSIVFSNRVTVAQLEDVLSLGTAHTVRVSTEYRRNEVATTPFAGGNVFYDIYSAGGMWNWNVLPELALTNAVRFDHLALGRTGPVPAGYPFTNASWNRDIEEWSFNSGIVWKVSEADTVRLLAGRGIQLPNLADLGSFVLASPFITISGVPTLDPTVVTNYELSWDHALAAINAQLRAAVFHSRTKDILSISGTVIFPPAGLPLFGAANVGDSVATGFELSIKGLVRENWRWGVNYRVESVKDTFLPFARNGIDSVDFEHVTPRHVFKANLGWTRGDWEADLYFYYQSSTFGLAPASLPGSSFLTPVSDYVSADARIAYRLTDWATVAISGQNLLDSPQRQTSGPAVERRVFATLTVNY